jgi:D-tyrosyl-tRNA(Tyr) deacylase
MRVVLQRVKQASVEVDGKELARIGRGVLILAGFTASDNADVSGWMAHKVSSLRIFEDDDGKMNRSLVDINGEILAVPQFTLYGDCRKGKRPGFDKSAPPEEAGALYRTFLEQLIAVSPVPVKSGAFREHMHVALINDGPVTLVIEKDAV